MRKLTGLVLLFCAAVGLSAETFTHKFVKGEKFRIVATVEEKVLHNDEPVSESEFLLKIAANVTNVTDQAGSISAQYEISARTNSGGGSYQLENEARSSFSIDPQGRYRIGPVYFEPTVRDVPLFPTSELEPGATWSAPGVEVADLREPYGVRTPLLIPVAVKYTYLGREEKDGRPLARLKIEYEYRHPLGPLPVTGQDAYPVKISGAHEMTYLWDIEAGKTDSYEEAYYTLYEMSNKDRLEIMGAAKGEMIVSPPLDKRETVDRINDEIEKEKLEGVKAESVAEGVRITLEDIRFLPDSDEITAAESRKIGKIAAILKRYPDRDIRVTGHTAAVGTPESCLELSLRRARAVGDALLGLGARRAEQMTIEGLGLTRPVAPNTTENGRSRNRRVEITILEN